MGHVILLGDSIFDNARYVPDRPPVIEQLRRSLPGGWLASLLAVDGHMVGDVVTQLGRLPSDATHLVVSAGGNDALSEIATLAEPTDTVAEGLRLLRTVQGEFRDAYRSMLVAACATGKSPAVCTIYDAIPGLGPAELAALALFNEVILREAFRVGLPIVDLRLVCDHADDYSSVSAIEPSMTGGLKIARAIAELVTTHDFGQRRSAVFN